MPSQPRVRLSATASLFVVAQLANGLMSASAATSVAQNDPTHPVVMQQESDHLATAKTGSLRPFTRAAPLSAAGTNANLQRETFGFALASSLNDTSVGDPTWDFSLLSTVAFFGLHVQDNGSFATDSGWNIWNSSELTDLINLAHSHGTKVVVTIIEQDFSSGTPHMCSALTNSSTTVTDTVTQVTAKGVDGVNVDYEGLNGSCGNNTDPSWARHALTKFAASLRSALPAASYLSIDTYASSAADSLGFFDIAGLAPYVDSFFVMAYDLEYSNWSHAPLNCRSFCLGPTGPLAGYYYNDTSTASQYSSVGVASKVILGVPYYGRKACVASATPNQYPTGTVTADTYLNAASESGSSLVQPGSYATHRDTNDPSGQERWDTWFNTSLNCTRELYWDDTVSLGHKYALVKADNLRGVGFWNLNYGGGAPELWCLLGAYFTSAGYSGPPIVSGISPSSGPSTGGTSVSITGCGFVGVTGVNFGSTAASSFTSVSSTQVTAVSPGHAAGMVDVTVTANAGASATNAADHFTFVTEASGLYFPHTPLRVMDTRTSGQRLGSGGSVNLALGGVSVPANAVAVVLNVTATNTSTTGFFAVYPTGAPRPLASNLNWVANQTVPNLVMVGLGINGMVTIYNGVGSADAVVDLEGYYAPSSGGTAGGFVALSPARITDTRSGSGEPNAGSTLTTGATLNVQVTGAGGVPSSAEAVVLNVTVTGTTDSSFLTVYPTGSPRPLASNLNWVAGEQVANRVVVSIGTGGMVSVFLSAGKTDVVIDVNGYFTDSTTSGKVFVALTPSRILDTRSSSKLGSAQTLNVLIAGQGGVPTMGSGTPPTAVVINVTAVNPTSVGFFTVYPGLTSRPLASDLNFAAGQTVPNLVVVKVGTDGTVNVFNSFGSTDVVIDVVGWYG